MAFQTSCVCLVISPFLIPIKCPQSWVLPKSSDRHSSRNSNTQSRGQGAGIFLIGLSPGLCRPPDMVRGPLGPGYLALTYSLHLSSCIYKMRLVIPSPAWLSGGWKWAWNIGSTQSIVRIRKRSNQINCHHFSIVSTNNWNWCSQKNNNSKYFLFTISSTSQTIMLGDWLCRYGPRPSQGHHLNQMHRWFLRTCLPGITLLSPLGNTALLPGLSLHLITTVKLPLSYISQGGGRVCTRPLDPQCEAAIRQCWGEERFWTVVHPASIRPPAKGGQVTRIWTVLGPDRLSPASLSRNLMAFIINSTTS